VRTRTTQRMGAGALCLVAAVPALLIAAPAAAVVAPATGDLTVTIFSDRFPDLAFDPSKVTVNGEADLTREAPGYLHLRAADGTWFTTGADADGRYTFENIPAGAASVYITDPNSYRSVSYFQTVTGGGQLMPATSFSFQDGTFQFTDSDDVITTYDAASDVASAAAVTVAPDAELTIGLTAVTASASVLSPADGSVISDLADIAFLSNGQRFDATATPTDSVFRPGDEQRLLPTGLGIAVDPAPGYAVAGVSAASAISGAALAVTERDGGWFVDGAALPSYLDRADFAVQLEQLPTADVVITQFEDRVLDGVFDDAIEGPTGDSDRLRNSGYVYIEDAFGDWWATTADAQGSFTFDGIPAGPATVHLTAPNSYISSTWWDATAIADYTEIERGGYGEVVFDDGTYLPPTGGAPLPIRGSGVLSGTVELDLAADAGEQGFEIGMAAVGQNATVTTTDGQPVGDAVLRFSANAEQLTAEPSGAAPGGYFAADANGLAYLSAADYGLAVDAPEGWEVAEVTAASSEGAPLTVTESAAGWIVAPQQLAPYFGAVEWAVVLDEAAVVTPPTGGGSGDGSDDDGSGSGSGGSGSAPAAGNGGAPVRGDLADTGVETQQLTGFALLAALLLTAGVALRRLRRA